MNISIFAKPYFLGIDPEFPHTKPYLHRGTSLIRGEQIAQVLGAKFNPKEGFEKDICIYLKPKNLDKVRDGDYVDLSDGGLDLLRMLKSRPNIKVITSSQVTYELAKKTLNNQVFLIFEHNCNFEGKIRTRKQFAIGGVITNPSEMSFKANCEVRKRLATLGLQFIDYYYYKNRNDVIDFYQKIDFQVIAYEHPDKMDPFVHPGKMINAGSFKIPSIAFRKHGYKEFEGCYLPINSLEEIIPAVKKLENISFYNEIAEKAYQKAQEYNVDIIAEKYRQLR